MADWDHVRSRDGKASRLAVTPDYRGDSFIPAMLRIRAVDDRDATAYARDMTVW